MEHKEHKRGETPAPEEAGAERAGNLAFPVIGIGASAGGLTAIEQFFTHLPPAYVNEAAFVVVQHLSPDHKSMLVELVQRFTQLQVVTAEEGAEVQAGRVYVIPARFDLSMAEGRLHLTQPAARRGLRLPIDFFFRSLAKEQRELAVGIILSGTGTDGTLGVKSIKEAGGLVMVQTPETAEYDGMPHSALATRMVDFVLAPEQMGRRLLEYKQQVVRPGSGPVEEADDQTRDILEDIFRILLKKKGIDFSVYKHSMTTRRIEKRMAVHVIQELNDYLAVLEQNPEEVEALFNDLLIGVTTFFRDPEAFDLLMKKAVPEIVRDRKAPDSVRVWVPGCSTGEEAYSLGILFREYLDREKRDLNVQIFATDVDGKALDRARKGVYSENIALDVSAERLEQFFRHEGETFTVRKDIREMVVFAEHNLIESPPFTRLDLISCRNVLIYLSARVQKKLIPLFRYALQDDGFLVLGNSEGIGAYRDLFTTIDRKWKLYQSKGGSLARNLRFDFTIPAALRIGDLPRMEEESPIPKVGGRDLVEKFLLFEYAPVCVVINERKDILYIYGHSGDYLEPAIGEASTNLMRMVRPGLRSNVEALIRKAAAEKAPAKLSGVQFRSGGKVHMVNLAVYPIHHPQSMQGLQFVVFQPANPADAPATLSPAPPPAGRDMGAADEASSERWEQEIWGEEDYQQQVVEQLESANQELKSKNEEMQAMYEELQSANEELETAKEEMQSVNEELNTVNAELQTRLSELSLASNDMKNLLTATGIATLFLDTGLRILRYTPAITGIVNLIPGDVGRPVSDIVTNLDYGDMVRNAKEVLETLGLKEIEVQARNGGWYLVRILPYRTLENIIEGVVITFIDITDQKRVQTELKALAQRVDDEREFAESLLATVQEPLLVLDQRLKVVKANRAFYELFQVEAEEIVGIPFPEVSTRRWNIPALLKLLREIPRTKNTIEGFPVEVDLGNGEKKVLRLNARDVVRKAGEEHLILLAFMGGLEGADGGSSKSRAKDGEAR